MARECPILARLVGKKKLDPAMSAAISGEDEDQRKIKQLQQELKELEARVPGLVHSSGC